METPSSISIPLNHIEKDLFLTIYPEGNSKLYQIDEAEANELGEVPYQILESQSYEYEFTNTNFRLSCDNNAIIKQSKRKDAYHTGRLNPSFYVGNLKLAIKHKERTTESFIFIEVLATKFNSNDLEKSYRTNYRYMLEEITEKCTELLLQINAPIQQHFETDFSKKNKSLYQQFSFINSIVGSIAFFEAIQKIISSPKTNWSENEELISIRNIKKFSRKSIKQLTSNGNRIPLSSSHPLYKNGIKSMPSKIVSNRKIEVIDNPENRFIKHALQTYLHFTESCATIFTKDTRSYIEAIFLSNRLEQILTLQFFKQISRPTSLNFNSPVLQRKSGYREILKSWLKFDLAAKLTWSGGEDVYQAGKRDISKLYEYWLFFKLYDLFKEKFFLNTIEHEGQLINSLIQKNKDGLNFIIKAGKHTALSGISKFKSRKLQIKFSYNQTFSGNKKYKDKVKGSYTKNMYPDYTLSFWPDEAGSIEDAEENEQVVHIHFDAKYKVNYFGEKNISREDEEKAERKGSYKNVDLFKMHAYKDAIRRTGGSYILYPGNDDTTPMRSFHEIIPGIGAFAIRPNHVNNGLQSLNYFIDSLINHLLDRSSQRENLSAKIYGIHKKQKKDDDTLISVLPESLNNHKLIPNDTFVLIGYYKSKAHLDWILSNKLYNFKIKLGINSDQITGTDINAKYIIFHDKNELTTSKIYSLNNEGVKIYSKADLLSEKYPSKPSSEAYLMFTIENDVSEHFNHKTFNLKSLNNFEKLKQSTKPYIISITELFKTKV